MEGRMTIFDMYKQMTGGELAGWALMVLILFLSLIQISPLKLNPWDSFFSWIGKKMNGRIEANLNDLWSKRGISGSINTDSAF